MLKNIVLVFTQLYIEKTENNRQMELFWKEMQKGGLKVALYAAKTFEESIQEILSEYSISDSLFVADKQETLALLVKSGCYTVACYHEDVEGLLGLTQYAMEGLDGMEPDYLNKVYQRYCGIPWEILQTKRCSIREMGPEDLGNLCELYSDSHVTRYTEALFTEKEAGKGYIEDYIENIYKYFGFGIWLIHRIEDGKLIGRAGFNYRPGYEEAELGFVIGYPFWNNGYAYEVCSHLLEYGKTELGFEGIQAIADKENMASIRLLEKLGFHYMEDVIADGRECHRYLYE